MHTKIISVAPEEKIGIISQKAGTAAGTYGFLPESGLLEQNPSSETRRMSARLFRRLADREEILLSSLSFCPSAGLDSGLLDLYRDTGGAGISIGFSVLRRNRHVNSMLHVDTANCQAFSNTRVVLDGYPDRILFRRSRSSDSSCLRKSPWVVMDSFGNLIQNESAFTVIDLKQSYEDDVRAGIAPVSLDLTSLGLGVYGNIVFGKAYEIASVIDGTYVYNTSPEPVPVHVITSLIHFSRATEQLLGLSPSTALKRIHIVHHKESMFRGDDVHTHLCAPGTILLQSDTLAGYSSLDIETAGVHETVHLVDFLYDISSHPRFIELYSKARRCKSLMEYIREQNFFRLKKPFGHPGSDPKELLASLLNTVIDEIRWKASLASEDAQLSLQSARMYYTLLKVTRNVLQEVLSDSTTPIVGLLSDRMKDLSMRFSRQ